MNHRQRKEQRVRQLAAELTRAALEGDPETVLEVENTLVEVAARDPQDLETETIAKVKHECPVCRGTGRAEWINRKAGIYKVCIHCGGTGRR